ncbi:hypothetical protein HDU79_003000 [Rhizoclosmatium sp. JEL0117]|nr:hypothetical protein HDU79_003000 [Rhizoclosmatium sp. JEL0117]
MPNTATTLALGLVLPTASYIIYNWYIYPFFLTPLLKIPGPNPNLNPFQIDSNETGMTELAQIKEYKSYIIRGFGFFNKPFVFVASPTGIKRVLGTHAHNYTRKTLGYNLLRSFFGPSLIVSNGDDHKRQRAIANPAFTLKNLIKYIPTFISSARETQQSWNILFTSGTSVVALDIAEEISKPTLDIIGRCAFDYEFNSVSNNTSDFYLWITTLNKQFDPKHILEDMIPITKYIIPSVWQRHVKLNKAKDDIRRFAIEMIDRKKAEILSRANDLSQDVNKVHDLMTLLLEANINAEAKRTLDQDELVAQTLLFVTAGHETTSTATTFALDFLAKHQSVQNKLRQELIKDMPQQDDDPPVQYITSSSTYLDAICKETLRLSPPFPQTPRLSEADDWIDGYFIPKGTRIVTSAATNGRLEEFWGEDVLEFKPERWLQPNADSTTIGPFIPFSYGIQNCIGQKFAEWEMKTLVAVLVRCFEFSPVEGHTFRKALGAVQKPVPNLMLNVKRIE